MIKLIAIFLLSTTLHSQLSCPNDPRCGDCYGDRCLACFDSYANSSGVCVEPLSKIERCLQYTNSSTCAKCQHGYKVQNNRCVTITHSNCAMVDSQDRCVMCNRNMLIDLQGQCYSYNTCTQSSCAYCARDINMQEFCRRCDDGYVLKRQNNRLTCVLEDGTQRQRNCLLLNSVTQDCEICDFNYYQTRTGCAKNYLTNLVLDPMYSGSQMDSTTTTTTTTTTSGDYTDVVVTRSSSSDNNNSGSSYRYNSNYNNDSGHHRYRSINNNGEVVIISDLPEEVYIVN